jgi:hypothetical protein
MLAALAVLAIALNAFWPRLEDWRTRRAIEAVITQQEQAVIAGDRAGLRASFKNPGGTWADDQVQHLQFGWQTAAFGLPGGHLDGQPGTISDYEVLAPELVRADVARTYVLADGTHAAFALPQYYQFVQGAWRQVPGPHSPTDDREALQAGRVYVHYNPADAGLAASTADDLEKLLARACADWNCPPDMRVAVVFGLPDPAPAQDISRNNSLSGSLTFQMLVAGQTRLPDLVVNLPTRESAGYPLDAAAGNAVWHSVAVQALANAAERLTGDTPTVAGPMRPFLYALVVRELARLGIESPDLSEMRASGAIVNSDQLWSLPSLGPDSPAALLSALTVLNRLMAGRPVTDEQHLLHALGRSTGPVNWLEVSLGLTQAQAQAAWVRLLSPP